MVHLSTQKRHLREQERLARRRPNRWLHKPNAFLAVIDRALSCAQLDGLAKFLWRGRDNFHCLFQKLRHAHEMLSGPQFRAWSVAAIAYEVGFDDISYFNRLGRVSAKAFFLCDRRP